MGCAAGKEPEPPAPPPAAIARRRASASAQGGIDPSHVNLATLPKIAKDEAAVQRISQCVEKNAMMKHLSPEYRKVVIDSMKEVKATAQEKVITQGEVGELWYVVEQGALEAWKKYEGEDEARKVKSYAVGDSFGELALMFNQRRAASVSAAEDSILWAVDQATFKAVMLASANANKVDYN